ncbi:MAG: hypothetical protein JWP78_705 [Mucilaginibacter sp.]|nr:hypothetical protein [Mucilaginibacter sp.]
MKKSKEESPLKAARKKARKAIEIRVGKLLKAIASELGQEALDIDKEAKKLAKKITKGLKPGKKIDEVKPSANGIAQPVKAGNNVQPVIKRSISDVKKPEIKAAAQPKSLASKAEAVKTTAPNKVKK